MSSEELKSKEPKPIENTLEQEEKSVLNRPRRQLKLADMKEQIAESVQKHIATEKIPEEAPKAVQIREKALETASELYKEASKELSENLKKGVNLKEAVKLIFSNGKMITTSMALVLITLVISILIYYPVYSGLNKILSGYYTKAPLLNGLLDYIYYIFWSATKFAFHGVVISVSFFIPFILAYIVTAPLHSAIRYMTDDVMNQKSVEGYDFSIEDILDDIKMTLPAAVIALALILIAFFLNLIAVIGQIFALAIFITVSALLLNDLSFKKYDFSLKTKIIWMKDHLFHCLRTGVLPAVLSMIPLANNIIVAFIFPISIVHAACNFENEMKNETHNDAE